MKKTFAVRAVRLSDAAALAEIYRPYVEKTAVSFEYEAPDAAEFERRIALTVKNYPYFVAVDGGRVIGYAYASPLKTREAYRCSAEVTVYLAEDCRGKGAGTLLYAVLERTLKERGVDRAYACISYPDRGEDETLTMGSVNFHYARGYAMCAYFKGCGVKFGRRYSVVWMEKQIN